DPGGEPRRVPGRPALAATVRAVARGPGDPRVHRPLECAAGRGAEARRGPGAAERRAAGLPGVPTGPGARLVPRRAVPAQPAGVVEAGRGDRGVLGAGAEADLPLGLRAPVPYPVARRLGSPRPEGGRATSAAEVPVNHLP